MKISNAISSSTATIMPIHRALTGMRRTPDAAGEHSDRGHGRLTDKAAVITGGASGIGRAVAIAYAREDADY